MHKACIFAQPIPVYYAVKFIIALLPSTEQTRCISSVRKRPYHIEQLDQKPFICATARPKVLPDAGCKEDPGRSRNKFFLICNQHMSTHAKEMAGPVVIITGASRGIGKSAVIQSLTKFNARVVAVARSSELLQGLQAEAAQLGKQDALEIVAGDVTDERVVHSIVERAIDRWGQLDSVVANAG